MVLLRRSDTELLSIRPLWPELAIPMVKPSGSSMADRDPHPCILRRHMDRVPLHILPPVEKPLMGGARIRHGTWRPSLGSDPLEYLQHGSIFALDSGTNRKWTGRTVAVVVARGARCRTGCR